MPRESLTSKRERAIEVCARMNTRYPQGETALIYHDAFSLVIAVLLSAQTTDKQVNKVTPELFRRWPTPYELAQAHISDVEAVIHSLGFYRTKAKHCVECAQMIVADFDGQVPSTMQDLCKLPGVGRKTANLVLNVAFDIVEGIAVDTHVFRISTRLGFTKAPTPLEAEKDLLKIIPQDLWKPVNHQWVDFGREVCRAQNPHCDICPLQDICPSFERPNRYIKKKKK